MEEIKSDPKNIIFATLTFSEESLKKLEYDEKEPNKAVQRAISLFRKRWWKKYKTPLKHWLITEMGHDNTKRIHLHGIIWTELTEEQFEKEWRYGWIFFGHEVNEKTINYIIKYVTKRDEANPEFNGKIFTSKGIGKGYADLIIKKEKLIREIWETELTIRRIENILTRNKILKPTKTEEESETEPKASEN